MEQILSDLSCQRCDGHPDFCQEEGGDRKVGLLYIFTPIDRYNNKFQFWYFHFSMIYLSMRIFLNKS